MWETRLLPQTDSCKVAATAASPRHETVVPISTGCAMSKQSDTCTAGNMARVYREEW